MIPSCIKVARFLGARRTQCTTSRILSAGRQKSDSILPVSTGDVRIFNKNKNKNRNVYFIKSNFTIPAIVVLMLL